LWSWLSQCVILGSLLTAPSRQMNALHTHELKSQNLTTVFSVGQEVNQLVPLLGFLCFRAGPVNQLLVWKASLWGSGPIGLVFDCVLLLVIRNCWRVAWPPARRGCRRLACQPYLPSSNAYGRDSGHTIMKSHASSAWAWLRTNVLQACDRPRLGVARRSTVTLPSCMFLFLPYRELLVRERGYANWVV
jgi:hypothetical protein